MAEGLPALLSFLTDLCHVQAARAAGEVGRIFAELVHGYNRHPAWDEEPCGAACGLEELDPLDWFVPGSAVSAGDASKEIAGTRPPKAGPCVRFDGLEQFVRMRLKLDGCLTGARLAKDRAAVALTTVMIPEALDYPH